MSSSHVSMRSRVSFGALVCGQRPSASEEARPHWRSHTGEHFQRSDLGTFTERRQRRQMARSFDDLAEDLDAGRLPRPRTMAEQLALMIVILQASAALSDAEYGEDVAALDAHPHDGDWDAVSDGLMDDRDAEAFYPPATAVQWLQIFPCDTWFAPRLGEQPRDSRRGFRR